MIRTFHSTLSQRSKHRENPTRQPSTARDHRDEKNEKKKQPIYRATKRRVTGFSPWISGSTPTHVARYNQHATRTQRNRRNHHARMKEPARITRWNERASETRGGEVRKTERTERRLGRWDDNGPAIQREREGHTRCTRTVACSACI